jgi:hypothetical protein
MKVASAALVFLVLGALAAPPQAREDARIGVVYFWKAKEGKLEAYNRYIREFAEPIDEEARRAGAFVSVTTYVQTRPDAAWTHMRLFLLKDRAQVQGLSAGLDAAKLRLHPDEAQRARQDAYAATLRDFVAQEEVEVLR